MPTQTFDLADGLQQLPERQLFQMYERWVGGMPPARAAEIISNLIHQMSNPFAIAEARSRIYGDMIPIFDHLLSVHKLQTDAQIKAAVAQWEISDEARDACLEALCVSGLVYVTAIDQQQRWAVPTLIAERISQVQSRPILTSSPLAMWGWLNHHLSTKMPREALNGVIENMHEMLVSSGNITSRLQGLESRFLDVVQEVVADFGGIISIAEFKQRFKEIKISELCAALEKSSLGTVLDLDLEGFGLRHNESTLVILDEVVSELLQQPLADEGITSLCKVSVGTDFVSNYSRFCSFLQQEKIKFTNAGRIFKTSGKRMAEDLLLNNDFEFSKFELLENEFAFGLKNRFILGSGQKNFILSEKGERFLEYPLIEKMRLMLDWLIEDCSLNGDMSHQIRMRRSAIQFLTRLQPGTWYDVMCLPFVVRNYYFGLLNGGQIMPLHNQAFPVRSSSNSKELSWDLLLWMRKGLHMLGIIDMAYDDNRRLVAMRLTSVGSELLGLLDLQQKSRVGHIVVNPDFEIVLFPDLASHHLICSLDNFCDRERTDSLLHFRLSQASVKRGVGQGLSYDSILSTLEKNSPTPIPQNVRYELKAWTK